MKLVIINVSYNEVDVFQCRLRKGSRYSAPFMLSKSNFTAVLSEVASGKYYIDRYGYAAPAQ